MRLATKGTEAENLFETLASKSPVGLYVVQDGKFCYTNPAFQTITGYSEDELLGRDSLELVVPEDRKQARINAIKMLKGERTSPYQFRVTHKNGSITWIMESVVPVQYRGRRATLGDLIDITEQKQAEEALQAERNKLQSLIDSIEYTVTIQDTEYNIIYQNEPSRIASGGDHLGEKCYRAYEGREKICNGCPVEEAFKDGKPHTTDRQRVSPSGEVTFWENTASPIRDAEGRIVACLELARDTTARKQVEESLQAEKNKLQSLIDALEYTLTIQDPEYNIIYQNEPSKIAYGDRLGEKCYRVYEGEEKVCDGCPVKKAFKDGNSHIVERQRVMPSGEVTFWEHTASPIRDAEGRIVSCIALGRNITERKKQEHALADEATRRRILIDQSLDGIVVLDIDARVVEANQRFAEMLGYTTEEIRELHTWDWDKNFPPEKILEQGRNANEKGFHLETKHTRKDGSVIDVDISINAAMFGGQKLIFCVCRDITARKQTQEALQAEKNKLQSLIDALADGFSIQDRNYNILFQNEPSRKTTGGERLGEKCYRIFEGREKVCDGCPVEKAFKDGKPHIAERQRILASGEVTFWENTANPIRDAKGKVVACLEIGRNITERKRATEVLQESEERYRELADSITDVFFAMDNHLRYTYWNKASEILTGIRAEDAIGKPLSEVFPDTSGTRKAEKAYRDVLKKQKPQTFMNDFDIDGRRHIFEISAYPSRGGVSVFARDITEHKKMEERLELLSSVTQQVSDATIITDSDFKITYVNKAAQDLFGYSLEEMLGKNIGAFNAKPLPKNLEQEIEQTVSSGKTWVGTLAKKRKDNSTFLGECHITPLYDEEGKISSHIDVIHDITERKQAEEALQAERNKLQSVIDAMTDALTIQDRDYNIIFQNEPARKSTRGERIGEKCYRAYEGRESICEGCPVEKAFKDGKPRTVERQRVLYGELSFWENTANPIRDASGKVVACLEIGRNITERKKAEEALNLQRAYFQQLFDTSPDAIIMMDTNDRAIQVNKGFEKLFGYSNEEAKGRSLIELIVPEKYAQEVSKTLKKILGGETIRKERVRRRKDGSLVDVSILAYPIRSNGKLIGTYGIYTDITERKKQEQALADELTRRRLLVDQSLDGIVVLDENDKVYEANQRFAEMLGYTPEEVRELHTWDWEKNYSREQIHEQGRKADEEGFLLETKHTRKDGSVIDVDISINAAIFGGQKLIFCVCRDVTERKKAEQALADELTRRRLLVDQSLDGIVVLDIDARVVEANQRFAEMLGYTMEEVRKLHTWDWEKNYTHEQILEMGQSIDEKGRHLETRHTRKDGFAIDVDISISAIMYGGQKLIFCIERDITEQKKMAEALKLAAEEWRRTFDSTSDAVSIHDKEFRIMRANKAFADMFQVSLDQIIGTHCYELHKGKKPKSSCPHKQTLTTRKPAAAEFYESHLGKYLLESTSPIFNEQGEVTATVHITRDVTEQKRQSERLMMADRLASVGELAAGTAHELNNPLTSVIGFSQLLMEKDIPDDIREDVKFIYDEAQRAANVTKNLLTFARRHTPVKRPSQINNIIEDVLKLRAYEHKVNSIEVKKHLAPDLPEIMVDYFQIQQVFLNIIINAEYFMTEAHKGGTLTITTKKENDTVKISFADDGPGIQPENLNRIFDPFFTTKEAGKGTGLGLSICHGIVTEHSGQIYAKSQRGKGATIVVELPVNTP